MTRRTVYSTPPLNLHWQYADRHEIEACGVQIAFLPGAEAKIGEYVIDTAPSEWSSLYYRTFHAAVFPVRKARKDGRGLRATRSSRCARGCRPT